MEKIIIVSDDVCIIRQIIKNINKTKISKKLLLYSKEEFNDIINYDVNTLYFIDAYDFEDDILKIVKNIKSCKNNIVTIININSNLKFLYNTLNEIDYCIDKGINFNTELNEVLKEIYLKKQNNLQISDDIIPVLVNKNNIENIYNLPNNMISISYKNGDNIIMLSFDKTTNVMKKIIDKSFYVDKIEINKEKRNYFTEPIKKLIVDLYLVYKIDCDVLSKHFRVDSKYIKKWASLSKYENRLNIITFCIGKLIIKHYLKRGKS